jgi:anti-anti-sigma factor
MRAVPEPPGFSLQTSTAPDGRTIVAAQGELDIATVPEFTAYVRERLAAGPVLVDLRELVFLDSAGVRALNTLLHESAEHGWSFAVCTQMHDSVNQILEITGMLAVLPLEDCPP